MSLLVPVGLIVLTAAAVAWMVWMPGRSYDGSPLPLEPQAEAFRVRVRAHVDVLAGQIGPRNVAYPAALDAAATYVREQLGDLGYDVAERPYTVDGRTYVNLEATKQGSTSPREIVVVGAHYDTSGDTPGADDNATGVAALLELARALREEPTARTVRLVAFTNEEPPFYFTEGMGSRVYAREAAAAGDDIVAMISLETLGYYSTDRRSQRYPFPFSLFYPDRGDFVGFVGDLRSRPLVRRALRTFRAHARIPSEGVAAPASLPGIAWSDQSSFWDFGWPAIMITDTAPFRNRYYHTVLDAPGRLDYARLARVVQGLVPVVRDLAGS